MHVLSPGDTITGGGGGWGDPRLRPVADVLRDVREGYVSAASAQRDYGVILSADGNLDTAATERARANTTGADAE